jgi:drug/metabolite transporter (DMT)-like permease
MQIIWGRYVFALPIVLVLAPPHRWPALLQRSRPLLQVGRALLPICAGLTIVLALSTMTLADATVISFVAPLLVTALSIPLLGETVGWRRWAAVLVGFAGVLVIARPGAGAFQWAALLPLGTALSSALYQIATKLVSANVHALSTLIYTMVVGFVVTSASLPFVWQAPSTEAWLLMALSGFFNALGHYAIIRAFAGAQASTLAPFIYTQIVLAAILGYAMFGEVPDAITWLGTAIIVASGLYVLHAERRAALSATAP